MDDAWDSGAAQAFPGERGRCTYLARLLAAREGLLAPNAGSVSVKAAEKDLFSHDTGVLYATREECDPAALTPQDLAAVRLQPLRVVCALESLPDAELAEYCRTNTAHSGSPDPSAHVLAHVCIPNTFVCITVPDALLAIMASADAERMVHDALGPDVLVTPGFATCLGMGRSVLQAYGSKAHAQGIVVPGCGLLTWADDARQAYGQTIAIADRLELYVARRLAGARPTHREPGRTPPIDPRQAAAHLMTAMRGECARANGGGQRVIIEWRDMPDLVDASLSAEIGPLCAAGLPSMQPLGLPARAVSYIAGSTKGDQDLVTLMREALAAPAGGCEPLHVPVCVFVVAGLGVMAAAMHRSQARAAANAAERALRAELQGAALRGASTSGNTANERPPAWLVQDQTSLPLQGQIALVTGAAGAIGYGIADCLLAAGAVVVLADINADRLAKVQARLAERHGDDQLEVIGFDVTDSGAVAQAFQDICCSLGGVDILVPNAGIACVARLEDLDPQRLRKVIDVNLMGTFNVIKASVPIFRRQGTGGNIVLVSSKNVFDPGAAFGAYSASKAGAHQIGRIAALELAEIGVRVNMVNPDAIFGDDEVPSGLWEMIGPERMKARGLDPQGLRDYYRSRNLLKAEVLARHVGNAVVFFATNQTPTTGATLPIDGGIPAAFPR